MTGAVLAAALLGGFYLLGGAAVVGLGWLAAWLFVAFPGNADAQAGGAISILAAVALLAALAHAVIARARPPDAGHPVDEAAAPGLWRLVRELAEVVGARPPDEIRLVAAVDAYVWADTDPLGVLPGRRRLYVGAPLLAAWPVDRVRAVLAHELGHDAGTARVAHRGLAAMRRTIAEVDEDSPGGLLLAGYAALYSAVARPVLRRAERAADAAAARAAGPGALAAALRDLAPLHATWELLVASYARWARTSAYEPGELLERFARSPRAARPISAGPPDPLGTHEPLAARLAALGDPLDAPDDGPPAAGLVAGPEVLADALRAADFHRAVETAARREAKLDAARLRRAGDLDDVLDLLSAAGAAGLLDRLGPASRWDDGGFGGADLGEYVAAAVVAEGVARWEHRWSAPLRLAPEPLGQLIAAACADPADVPRLREMLAGLGVVSRHGRLGRGGPIGACGLADQLFALCHHPDGRRAIEGDTLPAALAAAVLTDLRLLGRLDLDAHGRLKLSGEPTGDAFLDSVLARLRGSGRGRPVHEWLQDLGPDVMAAVADRAGRRGRGWVGTAEAAGARIVAAVDGGDLEGPDAALGVLLWAVERLGAALGHGHVAVRVALNGLGRQDPIALGVRTVTGLGVPLPRTPRS
ncbi:GPP34 family phosphoprotein [Dactylosporangium sp. NPDC051485]|uniref:GPP34 family phosphoprotein n=1 Tax=Dactylosporangium sp. NPDC051485 TaxID=3154846 RepID=UPI003443EDCE